MQLTDAQFRQRVIEIVTQAVQAYWELDFAYRNLEVQIEAVRLAEQQDASNRRQVEQGLLAPMDVVQTQTQIATFQQNVFYRPTGPHRRGKCVEGPDAAGSHRHDVGHGAHSRSKRGAGALDSALDAAISEALVARPEARENALSVSLNQLDARLSWEQAKPQVDGFATLSITGLAGHPSATSAANPFVTAFGPLINQINTLSAQAGIPPLGPISFGGNSVPPILVGGYGQALDALSTRQFTTALVGVNVSLPLRNRTAVAAAEVAAAEGRRLRTQQQQVELAIEQDVRNALQTMSSAEARLDAAVRAREYADQQYQGERRQFQAGTSTVFLVLQRQTDLIAARTREVRAQADRAEAAANVDRALARTIEAHNIQLKPDGRALAATPVHGSGLDRWRISARKSILARKRAAYHISGKPCS